MAVTPILAYQSCTEVSCSAESIFSVMTESVTTITVDGNTSTPLASIVTWKYDLVGVAVPDGWVDSTVTLSGSSGTSVPASQEMTGLPIGVSGTLALPEFDLSSSGLTFELYHVFALSLTVTTSDGCSSKSTITFNLNGDYYNYVLDYEDTVASTLDETPCDCGCGCDCDDICSCVTLTDETVYGTPNPDRADCTVTFAVYKVDSNLTETAVTLPTYDEATVTSISVDLDGDSWYKLSMTVAANDGSFSVNTTENIMVKCAAERAYNTVLNTLQCGNNDNDVVLALAHMNANLEQLSYKWCLSDYQGAQRILECINALGSDCGCTDC